MFSKIDELKEKLDSKRPLDKDTLKSLEEDLILRWTYNTNAIEGNTLTLNETKVVLEGITIGGKSLREHFEVANHREAFFWLKHLISKNKEISIKMITEFHFLVMKKNIMDSEAGQFRTKKVIISGASHVPPEALKVEELMSELVSIYRSSQEHPVLRAARFHVDFVKIHPFIDGNGRTGRLLLNYALMLNGFLPIIIEASEKAKYYDYLDIACTEENYDPFVEMVVDLELKALEKHLEFTN